MAQSLTDWPEDIILILFLYFDTARDFRALSLTCRALHQLVERDGWRSFVRTCFSSLSIPKPRAGDGDVVADWKKLAESLTWQSRSWDQRSLEFCALVRETEPSRPSTRASEARSAYHPVIDVRLDLFSGDETLVWGEGENLVARFRQRGSAKPVVWKRYEGGQAGFLSGYDDITSVSVVDGSCGFGDGVGILAGRAVGDLALVSGEEDRFGETITRLTPFQSGGGSNLDPTMRVLNSVDVRRQGPGTSIAVAGKSGVFLYRLSDEMGPALAPVTEWHLPPGDDVDEMGKRTTCARAKWMAGGDVLALALSRRGNALQFLNVTPSGLSYHTAAKNIDIGSEFGTSYANSAVWPSSLQPVVPSGTSGKGASSLLLSSWKDGTVR
jgi:hypothetical protein